MIWFAFWVGCAAGCVFTLALLAVLGASRVGGANDA